MTKDKNKNISKGKKIYNIVTTVITAVIFVFLVIVVGFTIWQRKSGGDANFFGYYVFEVITDSMSGTIEPGEVIISKKVDNVSELEVGEIITFIAPSGPLTGKNETHRIIEIVCNDDGSVQYIRTQGDNEQYPDTWRLSPSAVKAKYLRKSPFISGLREFLSHWYGYVVLIALPLLIVGVLLIVGYVKDRVAAETEKAQEVSLDSMKEEDKQKLLEDYLVQLKNSDNSAEVTGDNTNTVGSDDGQDNLS